MVVSELKECHSSDDSGVFISNSSPKRAEAYFVRALACEEKGKFQDAILSYSRAIKLDPGHARAYEARGLLYSKMNLTSLAQRDMTEYMRLSNKR